MKRLLILLATLGLLVCGCDRPAEGITLLVGTYGQAIHEVVYDPQALTFTETGTIPAADASYIAKVGDCLYAVSERGDESGAYSFLCRNGIWGQTAFISSQGADPCYILPMADKVLTADYSGGSLTAFSLSEGRLTGIKSQVRFGSVYDEEAPVPGRQEHSHIHQVKFHSGLLFVSDLGNDRIHVMDEAGQKALCDIPCGEGAGPRHMEMRGDMLYCLTELSGEVIVWRCANEGGVPQFTEVQRIIADDVFAGGSADIHISPDGRFLYTSHRLANDGICTFRIGEDGTLEKVGYRNTGVHPRNFLILPDGSQMIVACRDDLSLEVYDIDGATGLLSECRARFELPSDRPVCVIMN